VLHDGMPHDLMKSQGQGHRGPNVANVADFKVFLLRRYACNDNQKD